MLIGQKLKKRLFSFFKRLEPSRIQLNHFKSLVKQLVMPVR